VTPLAREELRRYCATARARKSREPWTFADWTDFAVAVGAVAGLIFLGGFSLAEQRHESRATSCASHLPDGRRLMAYHLSKDGPERCVYEDPRADRKTGRIQ